MKFEKVETRVISKYKNDSWLIKNDFKFHATQALGKWLKKIINTVRTFSCVGEGDSTTNTCFDEGIWKLVPNVFSIIFWVMLFINLKFFLEAQHQLFRNVWIGRNSFFNTGYSLFLLCIRNTYLWSMVSFLRYILLKDVWWL